MKLYLRGRFWYVTHWTGEKQIKMSTGCTDREDAEKKALALLAPIITQTDDEIRVATAAAITDKLARDRKKTVAEQIKLADCWDKYPHKSKKKTLSASTMKTARLTWNNFVTFCANKNVFTVEQVNADLAERFLNSCRPRWKVLCFIYCRAMFERIGLINNPFAGLRPAKPETIHREPLTREQIRALLAEADRLAGQKNSAKDAKEFAVFVRFLLYTGLRLGDAATTLSSQIDFKTGVIERKTAKTSKVVRFPLHSAMLPLLSDDNEFLFPSMADLYSRGAALTRRIKRLFEMADISGEPQQFCAHCLRTTFASICAENAVPLAVIQSWLGHNSQTVTRIYARIEDMKAKKAAMAKFPEL